tara:strand:- start:697 stop:1335 length:639 start_codon:yes stop_codon:yes gene_type:complete
MQAVQGTTDINNLPNELSSGNVVLNISEKSNQNVEAQLKKDRCGVCTLPLSQCPPTCSGRVPPMPTQLSKESINQIISGIKEAGNMTSLPSRDIPRDDSHITQDVEIKPNFIPDDTEKYINENTNLQALIDKAKTEQKTQNTLDILYKELQMPILVMLIYFVFQLPYIKKIMSKYAKFLFKKDGNENLYGYIVKTLLFGLSFFSITKIIDQI